MEQNKKEFELCNIPSWHELGYTGKGIKIAEIESYDTTAYFIKGRINDPFNHGKPGGSEHGTQVMDVMLQVAPDAEVYSLPHNNRITGGKVSGKFIEEVLPYVIKQGIHIVGASLKGEDYSEINELISKAKENGTVFVTSAGNEGKKGLGPFAKSNYWIAVGAVGYNDKLKKIFLKDYSSQGKELDIVSFSGLYVHPFSKDKGQPYQVEGTSFSSPLVVGMLALVQQFFLEKAGRTLYQDEIELFIMDHVIDLGEAGFDELYGYGLFVLPEPKDININKYLLRGKKEEEKVNWTHIIIHHTAGPSTQTVEQIRQEHVKNNGWRDIGYNYLIDGQGLAHPGRSLDIAGAHAIGWNDKAIGIAIINNLETNSLPERQYHALVLLVKAKMQQHGIPAKNVLLHKEVSATACPGKNFPVERFRQDIAEPIPEENISCWAIEAVTKAKNNGIMKGDSDGRWRPKDGVTREEMAVILDRLGLLG